MLTASARRPAGYSAASNRRDRRPRTVARAGRAPQAPFSFWHPRAMKKRKIPAIAAEKKRRNDTQLFIHQHECLCCGGSAPYLRRAAADSQSPILSLSVVIYRRVGPGPKGRQLQSTPRIQICENCLVRASIGGLGPARLSAGAALLGAISFTYKKMAAEMPTPAPDGPQ